MFAVAGAALSLLAAGAGAATGSGATGADGSAQAAGLGFRLERTSITPKRPLFDARRAIKLRYRFAANRRTDLRVRVLEVRSGRTVSAWRVRAARPGPLLERRWSGINRRGRVVPDGRYEFRVGPKGRPDRYAGRFDFHGHVYPVDGSHRDRGPIGEFGAGRSGGRSHEGFDILADCGTRLVSARGGRVRKVGYDDRLYGYYVLINGRKSSEQYFYAHLISPSALVKGERVHTGDAVGRIGQTGNAGTTPCHLHFELRLHGRPVDPEPELRRWDRWS